MSERYIGEIRMFAGTYVIQGWALCNGALLPISQFQALYSLLGTIYGGDGISTFALPDLRGRVPIHATTSPYYPQSIMQGMRVGAEWVTLQSPHLPPHTHALRGRADAASDPDPTGMAFGTTGAPGYSSDDSTMTAMRGTTLQSDGGGQPHYNVQPYQTVSYIIALYGNYPPRS